MAGNQRPDLMWCVETWVLAPDTLSGSPAHTWCHCAKGINSQTPTGGHPKTHREGLDGLAKEWSTLSDPTKDKSPKAQLVRAKARSPNLAFIHLSKDINFMMTRGQSCPDQVGGCGQVSWVGLSQLPLVEFIRAGGAARVFHGPRWVNDIFGVCFCYAGWGEAVRAPL